MSICGDSRQPAAHRTMSIRNNFPIDRHPLEVMCMCVCVMSVKNHPWNLSIYQRKKISQSSRPMTVYKNRRNTDETESKRNEEMEKWKNLVRLLRVWYISLATHHTHTHIRFGSLLSLATAYTQTLTHLVDPIKCKRFKCFFFFPIRKECTEHKTPLRHFVLWAPAAE